MFTGNKPFPDPTRFRRIIYEFMSFRREVSLSGFIDTLHRDCETVADANVFLCLLQKQSH